MSNCHGGNSGPIPAIVHVQDPPIGIYDCAEKPQDNHGVYETPHMRVNNAIKRMRRSKSKSSWRAWGLERGEPTFDDGDPTFDTITEFR